MHIFNWPVKPTDYNAYSIQGMQCACNITLCHVRVNIGSATVSYVFHYFTVNNMKILSIAQTSRYNGEFESTASIEHT